jgi:hypothetical protein
MIAIGGAIGTGLIIGTGAALSQGGPAGLLIGYTGECRVLLSACAMSVRLSTRAVSFPRPAPCRLSASAMSSLGQRHVVSRPAPSPSLGQFSACAMSFARPAPRRSLGQRHVGQCQFVVSASARSLARLAPCRFLGQRLSASAMSFSRPAPLGQCHVVLSASAESFARPAPLGQRHVVLLASARSSSWPGHALSARSRSLGQVTLSRPGHALSARSRKLTSGLSYLSHGRRVFLRHVRSRRDVRVAPAQARLHGLRHGLRRPRVRPGHRLQLPVQVPHRHAEPAVRLGHPGVLLGAHAQPGRHDLRLPRRHHRHQLPGHPLLR